MGGQAVRAPAVPEEHSWWVICFCAQWCGVCREFRSAFDALVSARPQLRSAWVDVEDEEDIVGDLDIETFPTVMVAGGGQVLFFGPVLPQPGVLARLVENLQAGSAAVSGGDGAAQALLERVQASR